eukprot:scaffold22191_cov69-Skeletonema_menzelii.AAC.1
MAMRLGARGIARRNDCFVERFKRRFWYDCVVGPTWAPPTGVYEKSPKVWVLKTRTLDDETLANTSTREFK